MWIRWIRIRNTGFIHSYFIPAGVHRPSEEHQRGADQVLRQLLRPAGQLRGDEEQAQARHLAATDHAAHPHSQGQ